MNIQEAENVIRDACIAANPRKDFFTRTCHECDAVGNFRLADVLLAIDKSDANWEMENLGCSLELSRKGTLEMAINEGYPLSCHWNLKDNLTDQSRETKLFIAELLRVV